MREGRSNAALKSVVATVAASDDGSRIERLVMAMLGCTRSEARALCDQGAVTLDGKRARKGDRARSGATLSVKTPEQWVVADDPRALDVRLERHDIVVVSKPAGVKTAPLAPGERGTLVNALVARYPEMRGIGYSNREPGIVHRLDTQTSGLLLAARERSAFERLVHGLRHGELKKRYLAVVSSEGLADQGVIDAPLTPDPAHDGHVIVAGEGAAYWREAHTRYRVLERGARWALVEVDAARAFRHQVRAHLAALGHPIAGDVRYGGTRVPELGERHALHASAITWAGATLGRFAVEDGAPPRFLDLIRS